QVVDRVPPREARRLDAIERLLPAQPEGEIAIGEHRAADGVDAEERRPAGGHPGGRRGGRRALRLQVDEERGLAPGAGRRTTGAGLATDALGEELPFGGREGFQAPGALL